MYFRNLAGGDRYLVVKFAFALKVCAKLAPLWYNRDVGGEGIPFRVTTATQSPGSQMTRQQRKNLRVAKANLKARAANDDEGASQVLTKLKEQRAARSAAKLAAKAEARELRGPRVKRPSRRAKYTPGGRRTIGHMQGKKKVSADNFTVKEGALARVGRKIEAYETNNGFGRLPLLPGEIVTIISAPYHPFGEPGGPRVDILRGMDDFGAVPLKALRPIRQEEEEED